MNNEQREPSVFGPPRSRGLRLSCGHLIVLVCAQFIPLYFFGMLAGGGISLLIDAASAAKGCAGLVLPIPFLVAVLFACEYAYRRLREKDAHASPAPMVLAAAILLFWIFALVGQSHKDAAFQHNLEARLQPWAESILARPRAAVVEKGTFTVRAELVPAFVDNSHRVVVLDPSRPRFGENEPCLGVYWGGAFFPPHGYVVGRRTLRLEEGRKGVRKVTEGMYRFQEYD